MDHAGRETRRYVLAVAREQHAAPAEDPARLDRGVEEAAGVPHRRARREGDGRIAGAKEAQQLVAQRRHVALVIEREPRQPDLRRPVRLPRAEPLGEHADHQPRRVPPPLSEATPGPS